MNKVSRACERSVTKMNKIKGRFAIKFCSLLLVRSSTTQQYFGVLAMPWNELMKNRLGPPWSGREVVDESGGERGVETQIGLRVGYGKFDLSG